MDRGRLRSSNDEMLSLSKVDPGHSWLIMSLKTSIRSWGSIDFNASRISLPAQPQNVSLILTLIAPLTRILISASLMVLLRSALRTGVFRNLAHLRKRPGPLHRATSRIPRHVSDSRRDKNVASNFNYQDHQRHDNRDTADDFREQGVFFQLHGSLRPYAERQLSTESGRSVTPHLPRSRLTVPARSTWPDD